MSRIVSIGNLSELPPHLSIGVIPCVTFTIAHLSSVIGSSSLAPWAAVMIAWSHMMLGDFCWMTTLARSSLEIIVFPLDLISETVIDKELSMTQRVIGTLEWSSDCKKEYPTSNIQTIIHIPRINRLWGSVMKLTGKFAIFIWWLLLWVLVVLSILSCYHSSHNLGYR